VIAAMFALALLIFGGMGMERAWERRSAPGFLLAFVGTGLALSVLVLGAFR
jgi:hypothetical protein